MEQHQSENKSLSFEDAIVLVVDDVPANLVLMRAFLERYNIQVKTVASAKEAIRELKGFTADLILMDLRMPVINGIEAANLIKQNERTKHIPIVAFTASLMDNESISDNQSFSGLLGKPIVSKQFFELLNRFLSHKVSTKEVGETRAAQLGTQ
jgi:two-component system, NarL family, sensor histidine kinase EvgS